MFPTVSSVGHFMRTVLAFSAVVAATLLAASPATAATVLDVGVNEGCGKSTCFNEQGRFTQTWSAKDAAGPMTIGKLLLDRGVLGSLDGSIFRLSFKLNGEEIGSWGSFMMAGIAGDQLNFGGESFTWNPEDGDLMLVLEIVQPKSGGLFSASFRAPTNDETPGDERPEILDPPQDPVGRPVSAAPEPAAWALMIGGLGLTGATLRRRRLVTA